MNDWLIQHGTIDPSTIVSEQMEHRRGSASKPAPEAALPLDPSAPACAHPQPNIAVFIKPLEVLDTQKWFGDADLRLDVLVVHGGTGAPVDLYHPKTLRFPRVRNGDDLAAGETGILVYYGAPSHFLAFSVLLARDRSDSDDLASLLRSEVGEPGLAQAMTDLASVVSPSPNLAAVRAGVGAALALGDLSYKLIRQVTPSCLGLFRAAWLARRDRFGIGRHPPTDYEEVRDFRFAYTIVRDA